MKIKNKQKTIKKHISLFQSTKNALKWILKTNKGKW